MLHHNTTAQARRRQLTCPYKARYVTAAQLVTAAGDPRRFNAKRSRAQLVPAGSGAH